MHFNLLSGESTSGQRALYEIGMTGIPVYNVNNNCSTGSSALILAKQLIETGQNDCVLAVGFEKMEKGSLGAKVLHISMHRNSHIEKIVKFVFLLNFSTPTEQSQWTNTLKSWHNNLTLLELR